MITLLDYGAGNVRSVINALERVGETVHLVTCPADIERAERLVFPGVGSFGSMMQTLAARGYVEPLRAYLAADRPFLGICLGLQALFEGSEEAPGVPGLGFLPGMVRRFKVGLSVPHIGWNGIRARQASRLFAGLRGDEKLYFVHSYHVVPNDPSVILTTTDYGASFVSSVQRGNVTATQFHPEKSGEIGLAMLRGFFTGATPSRPPIRPEATLLAKRVIACLDVRANDAGDLVVTKGDKYDVREAGAVRNLGRPVEVARRYYEEGADEIVFLNITGFRETPLRDLPMLEVLRQTSRDVFVPLTIGGGIRATVDETDRAVPALAVAGEYFRSGADKVSIGSDAVEIVEAFLTTGTATGTSTIEQIAHAYGTQAVVISIDPRRVYIERPEDAPPRVQTMETRFPGPRGERRCWYQCTIRGGREGRPVDAVTLARVCEDLGAGEILLNCIDRDGTNAGFDLELAKAVRDAVKIPVIASSGAGAVEHFSEVFAATGVEAALAAGIFHRREVPIETVKAHLDGRVEVRRAR
ncbi:MAG: imidazole glycerol phosphate synthase subunit HisF [Polyangiaceae bacterium]|nr:imidazole glycerol phosphate synthase subunit HisF [Polyangiaceae bacterium]